VLVHPRLEHLHFQLFDNKFARTIVESNHTAKVDNEPVRKKEHLQSTPIEFEAFVDKLVKLLLHDVLALRLVVGLFRDELFQCLLVFSLGSPAPLCTSGGSS